MDAYDIIRQKFIDLGYVELSKSKITEDLLWRPDIIFSKGSYTYLVLVKNNNSILPTFLNRIASIPKGNIIPIIVFCQKPSATFEKSILASGVSTGYFLNGKLSNIKIKKKDKERNLKKEIEKKLEHIDIFVSSKQDGNGEIELKERALIRKTINLLRDTRNYPFTAHLIEYDRFKLSKLFEHIDKVMNKCEWVIILLEDNYSDVVAYEIINSIKTKDHQNIFVFAKLTQICREEWKRELRKIEQLKNKSIKYLPYSDLSDLEVTLTKAINDRMTEICKKKGVKIFV